MLGWICLSRIVLLFFCLFFHITCAFESYLWFCLGFIFMPYTTLTYGFLVNSCGTELHVWQSFILAAAIWVDIKIDKIILSENKTEKCSCGSK